MVGGMGVDWVIRRPRPTPGSDRESVYGLGLGLVTLLASLLSPTYLCGKAILPLGEYCFTLRVHSVNPGKKKRGEPR